MSETLRPRRESFLICARRGLMEEWSCPEPQDVSAKLLQLAPHGLSGVLEMKDLIPAACRIADADMHQPI